MPEKFENGVADTIFKAQGYGKLTMKLLLFVKEEASVEFLLVVCCSKYATNFHHIMLIFISSGKTTSKVSLVCAHKIYNL